MDLILFTTSFPLGSGEQFLECEILFLSKTFNRVSIIPLTDNGIPQPRNLPSNCVFLTPLLPFSLTDKFRLFIRAVFNKSPVQPFLADFFKNKVYLRKSWFIHWLSAFSIARAAMVSSSFKNIAEMITPSSLIYFYWSDKSSALCPFLKKQFPVNKYIARFHGTDLYETKTPGYMPFREELIRNLDLAVFISEDGSRFFTSRYPSINLNKLTARLGVKDNGENIPSKDGVLRIVTCSNMVWIKRLHRLVEALHNVGLRMEWRHIGDGELFDEIKELAGNLPPEVKVTFPGSVKNTDLMQYYRDHPVDLFINTSSHEGLPVSIMEAISFGIPVIAPAVGGIPEIVEPEHGFLLSSDAKPDEIADAIRKYHIMPAKEKDTMRSAARKFWKKHYDADVNYPEFCRQLMLLMEGKSGDIPIIRDEGG